MLRIIVYTSTLFLSIVSSAQSIPSLNGDKELLMDIRGTNCKGGLGNCDPNRNTTNTTNMNIYTVNKLDFNKISFEIDPQNLSPENQIFLLGKEFRTIKPGEELKFLQNDDFIFDIDTLIYLDVDLSYRLLQKGYYPVTVERDKIKVTLTLSYHK